MGKSVSVTGRPPCQAARSATATTAATHTRATATATARVRRDGDAPRADGARGGVTRVATWSTPAPFAPEPLSSSATRLARCARTSPTSLSTQPEIRLALAGGMAASSASAISRAVWNRQAASWARALVTMASRLGGTWGASLLGGLGVAVSTLCNTAPSVSPTKRRCRQCLPEDHGRGVESVRRSTGCDRICSGAMYASLPLSCPSRVVCSARPPWRRRSRGRARRRRRRRGRSAGTRRGARCRAARRARSSPRAPRGGRAARRR